jgi:GH35 family endo-1,4-beta-xylanase
VQNNISKTTSNPHDIISRTEEHLATTDRYKGDMGKVLNETIDDLNSLTSNIKGFEQ